MRDRETGRIIWYLFSAVLIKWGVEIAVATFALSCGLRSNMGIGAVSSDHHDPNDCVDLPERSGDAMKSSRNPGGNIRRLPDMECGLLCSSVQ